MVQNCERTLAIALESLSNVYDELIIVDGGSNDSTGDIALSYGAKLISSPWTENHSQQRNVYLKHVKTDWVFVLDSDEFINTRVSKFLNLLRISNHHTWETDNFSIMRKWISPFSKNHYIVSYPHFPDWQSRLFHYNENIFYEGQIHESIINFAHNQNLLLDENTLINPNALNSDHLEKPLNELASIYHLDLFINSKAQRRAKVRKYSQLDPKDGRRHYYLPNEKELQLIAWDDKEVTPSVQILLNNLSNTLIENSQLNYLIPPEIKADDFYEQIHKIAQIEDISTILEIGSSSGAGSTEALVAGMRNNPSNPTLFCMEISKTRFTELHKTYKDNAYVKCYNVSSVSVKDFPDERQVLDFYNSIHTNLNFYPAEQIISWLRQDIDYVKNSGVPEAGINIIKRENNIDFFDLVLIDGSEFTGIAEFSEVYGAKYICLDDINSFKNYHNYQQLLNDPSYSLLTSNFNLRNGYAIFKLIAVNSVQTPSTMNSAPVSQLPIHFFTIVLNGQPFIRYHIEVFSKLPFSWHWHIIEGVADLRNDTEWSLQSGGRITDDMHKNGLSNDGTTEYIDEIKQQYPQNITVYRKSDGSFWHGKREMVNEPLYDITEECLLWQVDVDELWTVAQICVARQMFIDHPEKTAAFYWCLYFVGQNITVSNRYCYSQNPKQEWLRTWRYKSGAVWVAHEPPRLEEPFLYRLNPQESAICIEWREVSSVNPFTHQQTENLGLVFQHFAYVTENQLRFKEKYYGYKDAVSQWEALQKNTNFPAYLREYFPWVTDETQVDLASLLGIVPIAQKNPENDDWHFLEVTEIKKTSLTILVDGVFFQMYKTGIARVWKSLLEEWSNNGFAKHVIVLNRNGTAPKIPGIAYLDIPLHDYNNITADQEMLQQICNEEGADLFISSYYTTPISTISVLMIHDMIPEIFDWNLEHPMWQEKHHAIHQASAYIAVSENTAKDLVKFFPHISWSSITIAHNGVNHHIFSAAPQEIINHFRIKYGIDQPYFLLVGAPDGYKNSILFFRAFAQLASHHGFDIVITSNSGSPLSPELRTYTSGSTVHLLQLSDEELAMAYSGAVALVYPSKYEGFGMPIVEAMACGCPVITCPNASIPEVGGDAVVYVNDEDVNALVNALCDVQKPSFRKSLTSSGLSQAEKFSWTKMAQTVSDVLVNTMSLALNLTEIK
jgi:glycosyltransferase involved in cell wall biosynthesis